MEHAQRMLVGGQVVAQHQIQLVPAAFHARHGGDGVVGHAVGLGIDAAGRVGIAAPGCKHLIRQGDHLVAIVAAQHDAAHRPVGHPRLHRSGGRLQSEAHAGAIHGKYVAAALEVVVGEDGAADDGQVGIGAQEVMRELLHKVEQAHEALVGDLHGHVLPVEHDAVLIIIGIGRILQIPGIAAQTQGHDAVVLPGREARTPGVARVLHAEHAAGVARLLGVALCGDVPGILLRLGEVDGDLQLAAGRIVEEAHVLGDAVHADVVHILAQLIEVVRGGLRALFAIQAHKALADQLGMGGQRAHDLRGKQIALLHAVGEQAARRRQLHQRLQNGRSGLRRSGARGAVALRRVHGEDLQQAVQAVLPVLHLDQMFILRKVQQRVQMFGTILRHNQQLPRILSSTYHYPAICARCQAPFPDSCHFPLAQMAILVYNKNSKICPEGISPWM